MSGENDTLTIGFTGDVMIGRTVDEIISQKGYLYPWGNTLAVLKNADIRIINLETTLTSGNRRVEKVFHFRAAPDKVNTLSEANITLVTLANNHILDFSVEGLAETIRTLDGAGIKHVGAGMNEEQAAAPELIVRKNTRVGVIGFTDNEPSWKALEGKSGTNFISLSQAKDRTAALALIRSLRESVDILIVSIHWGYNMQQEPASSTIAFAHEMIMNGVDIIHGHSAHIFQGIESYEQKLILYDCGDFLDDYVVHENLRNDLSFFFLVKVRDKHIQELSLIPVAIDQCQVNLATSENRKWGIERMQRLSEKFATQVNDDGIVML